VFEVFEYFGVDVQPPIHIIVSPLLLANRATPGLRSLIRMAFLYVLSTVCYSFYLILRISDDKIYSLWILYALEWQRRASGSMCMTVIALHLLD
jgi:hypothetical protein